MRVRDVVRFAVWNVGVRVCDLPFAGAPIMRWAVWFEAHTPWVWPYRLTGCGLFHPDWLLPRDVPETWWDKTGWHRVPSEVTD